MGLGNFSTEILDDHKNRVKNLRIAAESLTLKKFCSMKVSTNDL